MIGIRCERGSHKFFKRYGERFEDSEGKRIFLEFADEERPTSISSSASTACSWNVSVGARCPSQAQDPAPRDRLMLRD